MLDQFYHLVPKHKTKNTTVSYSQEKDELKLRKWQKRIPNLSIKIEKNSSKSTFVNHFQRHILVKKRIRKGVPNPLRKEVWPVLINFDKYMLENKIVYTDLVLLESPFEANIDKDLPRTLQKDSIFSCNEESKKQSLRNILKSLSLADTSVGYCQGTNFIAALLLTYFNEEEAFGMMCCILKQFRIREYYEKCDKIKESFFILNGLIHKFLPKIAKVFDQNNVQPHMYAAKWFLTLYIGELPDKLVLRIFDTFLFEGTKILYRMGLAVLKIKEHSLVKALDFATINKILSNYNEPEFCDEDMFFKVAFGIKFHREDVQVINRLYLRLNEFLEEFIRKQRKAEIEKIGSKMTEIEHDLDHIYDGLTKQLKWIEIDDNNIKFECKDLLSELQASNSYFETKLLEKRRLVNEKYSKVQLTKNPDLAQKTNEKNSSSRQRIETSNISLSRNKLENNNSSSNRKMEANLSSSRREESKVSNKKDESDDYSDGSVDDNNKAGDNYDDDDDDKNNENDMSDPGFESNVDESEQITDRSKHK